MFLPSAVANELNLERIFAHKSSKTLKSDWLDLRENYRIKINAFHDSVMLTALFIAFHRFP